MSDDSADIISSAEKTPRPDGAEKERSLIRYASPPTETTPRPSYRKRYGRGGRLFIDRRGLKRPSMTDPVTPTSPEMDAAAAERAAERTAYDLDSDDDDARLAYSNDSWADWNFRYRIAFSAPNLVSQQAQQQRLVEEAHRRQQAQASANAVINGPAAAGAHAALPATARSAS